MPGVLIRTAVIAPPYVPAQYIEVKSTIAESGSKVMVNGKINAPPVVGPNPGKTPRIRPNKVPKNKTINNLELNRGTIIKYKFSILSIINICNNSRWKS